MTIAPSFLGLCILLGGGYYLRIRIRLLRQLYLPACVIGGLIGLAIIQTAASLGHSVPSDWTAGWGKLPGFLINIVFACLFMGAALPKFTQLARRAGPQLAYGQIVAWGQYVVGIGLFLLVITRLYPDLPEIFAAILPVGFEGGHGTAAGLSKTFEKLDWEAGKDFALASATIGMISAIVVGMALVNWAVRRGHTTRKLHVEDIPGQEAAAEVSADLRPVAGRLTVSADAIETLTLHLVFVGVAIGIGLLLKQCLLAASHGLGNETFLQVADSFPLFPLCMIGGLVVQLWEDKVDKRKLMDVGLMRRIQNTSLDFLIVAAIATINIKALIPAMVPFAIVMVGGILWNVFCVLVLARFFLPNAWFERAIAEMGQSMGVTATGLLLLRVVDPEYKTPAADAFASKQLLQEPFMGGGLWTSAAIPLLAVWGGWKVFAVACGAVAAGLIVLTVMRIRRKRSAGSES